MNQGWVDASKELPEEDTTLLVYLECDYVTLGIYLDGRWHWAAAPWDATECDGSQVLFWMELPAPPDALPSREVNTAPSIEREE